MEFHLLPIFTLLSLTLGASHAALTPEAYWKSVLPNTPMPNAVKDLLRPGRMEAKSTWVKEGKAKKGDGPVIVLMKYQQDGIVPEDQIDDISNAVGFYLENDMNKGTKMNLKLIKSTSKASFLPRKVADSIPFTSAKIPAILNRFSVKPNSVESETIKEAIKLCEEPGNIGEEKYCATSLESMVDFSTSKLGKRVEAISTEVEKETQLQQYTVSRVKKMGSKKAIVCHKQNYPYALFYCHATNNIRTYLIALEGIDGTKVKAAAVCHIDTAGWNPNHVAFQVLKVKPGTVPVCHFLPGDNIVWVSN